MRSEKMANMILLPIHPEYVDKIRCGLKRFEFRRQIPRQLSRNDNDYIAIYCTSPVCKVVGCFKVSRVLVGSPSEIWAKTFGNAGIERKDFDEYFRGRRYAYALCIGKTHWLNDPITLFQLRGSKVAPQSFVYLSDEQADKIIACCSCAD